jgi:hypothetical protein
MTNPLTAGQYGMLAFFSVAAGAHAVMWLLGKWQLWTHAVSCDGAAALATSAAAQPRKAKTVQWSDPVSVMKLTRALLVLGAICGYCFVCEKMPLYAQGSISRAMLSRLVISASTLRVRCAAPVRRWLRVSPLRSPFTSRVIEVCVTHVFATGACALLQRACVTAPVMIVQL